MKIQREICKKHPKYQGIRKPRSECGACWSIWMFNYPQKEKNWITLSKKDKEEFVRACNDKDLAAKTPTFFNLESDKNDSGGRFADMTKKQVIQAAEDSAKWIKGNL